MFKPVENYLERKKLSQLEITKTFQKYLLKEKLFQHSNNKNIRVFYPCIQLKHLVPNLNGLLSLYVI